VRNFLLLVILFSSTIGFGQMQIRAFDKKENILISSADDAASFIKQNYFTPGTPDNNLKLQSFRRSPYANYYTFIQTFQDIEIQHTQIKISTNLNGEILFITGNYFETYNWVIGDDVNSQIHLSENIKTKYHLTTPKTKPLIKVEDDIPELYYLFEEDFENDRSKISLLIDKEGNLIEADDHRAYFTMTDTVVYGYAFKPDPLSSAGVLYGGEYDDNNDENNSALNAQMFEVVIRAQFEDGYFYLRTDSLKLKDLAAPGDAVVIEMNDDFHYTRDNNNFEDVNTIYHIQNLGDYLKSIGYEQLYNFYIEIDPHGAGGADQSYFVGGEIPSIQYGEGGVDDAEDADVLIHEYAHALSFHAAPNTNDGNERRAADEGYGDYFAVSYSRMFSDYNWENVFSWDGHNEFWSGRNANTNKHYGEDVSADFYSTSEIWSGALMDIFDLIGKENTDQLICEALYGSFEDMSLHDAALLIINAEDILFAGTYHETIYTALQNRGLLWPVAIEQTTQNNSIQFNNTFSFCSGNESLEIILPGVENYSVQVCTVDGRDIYKTTGNAASIYLDPEMFNAGLLVVSVTTPNGNAAIKLVKG
jgi:hypothetical protein